MRILFISNQFYPVVGGIENFLRAYAPALADRGHDVAVLTSQHPAAPEERDAYAGVAVHRTDLERVLASRDAGRLLRGRRAVEDIVRDFAPDVVHAHDVGIHLWAYLRTRADRRAATVLTIQTSMPSILPPESLPTAFGLAAACDWVTGVSRSVLAKAVEMVPDILGRSSVLPNAVPMSGAAPVPPPQRPRVLCLGRLVPQKGFDVAVAAMPYLLELVPDAALTIAGDGVDREALHAQVVALGLTDRVEFAGVVAHDEVSGLLDHSSVVAMPSRFEGLPLVFLEAAVRARPVVGTAAHGLGEVVVDGETGVVVPMDDPIALAESLAAVLRDPTYASALGSAARDRVIDEYSMTACIDAYTSLYEHVIARRQAIDSVR